jgi:outer membrane immunogenic protein
MNFFSNVLGATCASVIALGVSSVNAADMYQVGGLKDGVAEPTLAGFYVGINGGGSFGASNNLVLSNSRDFSQADIGQFSRDSGFGGVQIGYTSPGFGWGNRVVLGLETDVQGAGIDNGFTRADLNYDFRPAFLSASQSIDFFGTARARVGYLFDRTLVYATAGFAYAGVKTTVNINHFNNFTFDTVETGYAAGAGVEYLLAPCWSLKVEYQYVDLYTQTVTGIAPDGSVDHMNVNNNFHTVRAGLNYHFLNDYVPLK